MITSGKKKSIYFMSCSDSWNWHWPEPENVCFQRKSFTFTLKVNILLFFCVFSTAWQVSVCRKSVSFIQTTGDRSNRLVTKPIAVLSACVYNEIFSTAPYTSLQPMASDCRHSCYWSFSRPVNGTLVLTVRATASNCCTNLSFVMHGSLMVTDWVSLYFLFTLT